MAMFSAHAMSGREVARFTDAPLPCLVSHIEALAVTAVPRTSKDYNMVS